MEGYFLLHRKMLNWEWADDHLMFSCFIRLIALANWEEKKWHGVVIPRGSFISSRAHLARDLRTSQQAIRTVCQRLKSTNELTSKSTNHFTMYTIVKYEEYQNLDLILTNRSTSKRTSQQPAVNQRPTTTNTLNTLKERNTEIVPSLSALKELDKYPQLKQEAAKEAIWNLYPKKRPGDQMVFDRVWFDRKYSDAEIEQILRAVKRNVTSPDWIKDGGKYVPRIYKFLEEGSWKESPRKILKTVSLED